MAIRLPLPPTVFPRLRVRWYATCAYFVRQNQNFREMRERALAPANRWWQFVTARASFRVNARLRAEQRLRDQLTSFESRYEDLVDLLCVSANEGVRPEHTARYAELRRWMCHNYRRVRPGLRKHWVEPNAPEAYDPFEALFASENMEEVLHAATGIEDIMQTRYALEAYREELNTPPPAA